MIDAEPQAGRLSQRELRNESGRGLRAVSEGRSFVLTNSGGPCGADRAARRACTHIADRSPGTALGWFGSVETLRLDERSIRIAPETLAVYAGSYSKSKAETEIARA